MFVYFISADISFPDIRLKVNENAENVKMEGSREKLSLTNKTFSFYCGILLK